MSRLYPEPFRYPWSRRKGKRPYAVSLVNGSQRVWYTDIEHDPEGPTEAIEPKPEIAGYVLRNGVYVWTGRGKTRRKPK